MADSNSPATGAISKSDLERVFEVWETERDQLLALTDLIERLLEQGPGPDDESPCFTAWKLTEIASKILSNAGDVNALKRGLLAEPA